MEAFRHGTVDRYRQIVEILARHGFGYLVDQLGLAYLVPFQWGLLGHRQRPEPYDSVSWHETPFQVCQQGR